jgi:hypothetical protein
MILKLHLLNENNIDKMIEAMCFILGADIKNPDI